MLFRSADFFAHMGEPDFPEVMADTARFLDSSSLNWILTEEPRIVIGE